MFPIVIIYGPTAVGKSGVAVELAKRICGEIISADSMQIYKKLDIGSAKITKEEMQGIPHHLVDILDPSEEYSAALFCADALNLVKDIYSRGKTPIIVGGTGLYINGFINGFGFGEVAKNEEFRASLKDCSNEEIYEKIIKIEPNIVIDVSNRRRLVRALEMLTYGRQVKNNKELNYPYMLFAIVDDRQKIYNRINDRVDNMISMGVLDEAKYLLNLNLKDDALCMKAIGYKELFPYILGKDTLQNCIELLKQKTRNYAKRQFTYMNQFKDITMINYSGVKETANLIYENIKGYEVKQ